MALTGQFYRHAVFNAEKSKEAGRKIFEDKIYIEIRAVGDKNTSFSRPMIEADKTEFARSWQHFLAENGSDEEVIGTPLRSLPMVGPSMVHELKAAGIYTVEDILTLDDAALDRIRGGRRLQTQARAYIAAAEATAGDGEEFGEAPQAIDDEATQVDDDDYTSDLTGEAPKRGPGRPRKEAA